MSQSEDQTGFQVATGRAGSDEFVVLVQGEVDLYTAPELKAELSRLADEGARRIVVDLTRTTFIDSTTLGVLLGAVRRLRPVNGELAIVCADTNIRRIFEITLLDRVLAIHGSLAEAFAGTVASEEH
jgi:anti-sigma B factor antagonist